MHPINCRCRFCLVDRSSFGTPEAKALRESVSGEEVARALARARALDARRARVISVLRALKASTPDPSVEGYADAAPDAIGDPDSGGAQ